MDHCKVLKRHSLKAIVMHNQAPRCVSHNLIVSSGMPLVLVPALVGKQPSRELPYLDCNAPSFRTLNRHQ
jgi:hypothetical protein